MRKMSRIKSDIVEFMENLKVVDHHEHMRHVLYKKNVMEIDLPFFLARGYLRSDLVSSGLQEAFYNPWVSDPKIPESFFYLMEGRDESEKTWSQIKPYLEKVRNTTYYQYLLIALKELYGYEREDFGDDWKELSHEIRAKSRTNPEWALKLLDQMGIHKVILDIAGTGLPSTEIVQDERLAQVVRMDDFITGTMSSVGVFRDEPVRDLKEYLEGLDQAFQKVAKARAIGIKSGLAYQRILEYLEVPRYKAERIFVKGLENASSQGRRLFQDFMMHEICKRCGENGLPFQIHTGIQAGNYNTITNADPTHLTNLLRRYPDVKFDVFHGGYPYCREAGMLAKYFPNAYVDGCWLTHISPTAYKDALSEWLEIVPVTKIFAWGGDHIFPEHVYASFRLARDLIAEVLALKVSTRSFSMKTAQWVAERIMGLNAREVFNF